VELLTNNQKTVLKLHLQGKKVSNIVETTGLKKTTVYYAICSGQKNLADAMATISLAARYKLLDERQLLDLKKILDSL
jgi:predicted DNA-binding protein YlxM (UPF0122 family)